MNREEIMRMAEASGVEDSLLYEHWRCSLESMTRFAELVAEAERNKYEAIITNMAKLLEVQQKRELVAVDMIKAAILAEREACAKLCEEQYEYYGHDHVFAKAIRARGQA
jgi:hypothetical protein